MQTQQTSLVSATVDGKSLGVFDTLSGGDVSAEPTKRRSGGMGGLKSYAALPDYDDITIGRQWDLVRDYELARGLRLRVGRAVASISEQPLDDNGAPWGKPVVWSGRLVGVTGGDADSDSADARMLELTFQIVSMT